MEEMEEIAHGLELSKVNFIWVVRVGERGMVVEGWAPQVKILRHSSIGGFVTHCGWNFVLESIEFGVPIMAMPMHLDQPLNPRLIEEVGVGVEVKRDQTGRLHIEEIARVLKTTVVEQKNGIRIKRKARELSEKITMKKEEEIDEVVGELVSLCGKRK
ncbi:beta-D-glucosyl crocetin beta-1,6-glucosyltransferase-like [Camellia sinensis]|uniref:beta-D-glucosyl crocetin beta-1,6-glucosyltransferase-like n=1 Tax=Camellia sinensis TaxID=4442 RepID=UPI001035B32B|nr:beta-D-glucosyl crocetin beta-1,6-glucosyltransferase-like [Camellia sinensis]